MDFMRIVRSLEEFLYEVMTWLVFYPRTMWRAILHPVEILHYANRELRDKPDQQFTDLLSPPLFLMITILLSHMIEVASHQTLTVARTTVGQQIVASEQNLLILRSVLFSIYPLMFAASRLKRQGLPMNRETLRAPFFAQCYIAAPAAFTIGVGTIIGRAAHVELQIAGLIITIGAVVWYLAVEAVWLHRQARIGWVSAGWSVFKTWLAASMINTLVTIMVLGM